MATKEQLSDSALSTVTGLDTQVFWIDGQHTDRTTAVERRES
jgi:hypothetical protein